MNRAMSIAQLYSKKRKLLNFDGAFLDSFGKPEATATWLIWAESGSGKTTFVAQLCKYLAQFDRVAYNSMEEGDSQSITLAFQRVKMQDMARKVILLDNEPIADLKVRLRKEKAPRIVIIDSIQYADISFNEYLDLRKEFKNTLFIIISHADGKLPAGKVANKIRYDASIKIFVRGFVGFPVSRYGGNKPFVIWEKGANEFHGIELNK